MLNEFRSISDGPFWHGPRPRQPQALSRISVATSPGHSAVARMPNWQFSWLMLSVIALRPCLAAE